jgi:hypothetical protein
MTAAPVNEDDPALIAAGAAIKAILMPVIEEALGTSAAKSVAGPMFGACYELAEAVAPLIAQAVAGKILAYMEAHYPKISNLAQRRARRYFTAAAWVAVGTFTSGEDLLRQAAEVAAEFAPGTPLPAFGTQGRAR